jgi:hypothetical protein
MNWKRIALFVLAGAALANAESPVEKSFTRLKSLAGSWSGTNSAGKAIDVLFRETAGGSALLSEIRGSYEFPENMISVFHLDRDRLVMTHYCSVGNQPRMQASASPDGKTITFDFFDATNLAAPEDGHMQRVAITILETNHHTETWTFIDHGKESSETYDLRRAAMGQNHVR